MILKLMQNLCKKHKRIDVRYYGKRKFITDGYTLAYIGACAPDWTAEDFAISMGLDEDEQEHYYMSDGEPNEDELEAEVYYRAERLAYSLNVMGEPLQPFTLGDGSVFFVNMENMRVFSDTTEKEYYYKELGTGENTVPMLAMVSAGYVIGMTAVKQIFIHDMKCFIGVLAKGLTITETKNFNIQGGQMSIEDITG